MKAVLVNDTLDWCHWGCMGTSTILRDRISQFASQLTTISARETYTHAWQRRPTQIDDFKKEAVFEEFCKQNSDLIEKIQECDAVIFNGEGTIHGVKYTA